MKPARSARDGSPNDTDDDRSHPSFQEHEVDRGLFAMGGEGSKRCWNDEGERGAGAKRHSHFLRHAKPEKNAIENGHDHRPAANPEDPRQEAHHSTRCQQRERQGNKLHRHDANPGADGPAFRMAGCDPELRLR